MNKTIRLKCRDCDCGECDIYPIGIYLNKHSKKGCVRLVSEEMYIQYYHDMNEELPFLKTYKNEQAKKIYNEIINHNNLIYNCPITKIITDNGNLLDSCYQDSNRKKVFHEGES